MKRNLALLLALLIIAAFAGCGRKQETEAVWPPSGRAGEQTQNGGAAVTRAMNYPAYTAKDGTWAIYLYICGADLESDDPALANDARGLASMDISEVVNATLPDNVNVVMQMGGAADWQNGEDPSVLTRALHGAGGISYLEPAALSSMGDPNTLADFLSFCNTEYPAEHQAVILWDHGGGSLFGFGSDELFDHDSLSLPELNAAFGAAPAASGNYEIIGFDACLMATVDVVAALKDYGNYLVASEELEAGTGWYYTGALEALAADTSQSASQFAQAICDTFYQELLDLHALNDKINFHQEATLSVIDLTKADVLLDAYAAMADETLLGAVEQQEEYMSAFSRAARASENYGYNTAEDGFFEMVDMGDLANNAASLLPESKAKVDAALRACVVYQVKGPLRQKASGVSCYYCYSGDPMSVEFYNETGGSKAVSYYHEYSLNGMLTEEGLQYVSRIGEEENQPAPAVEELPPTEDLGLEDFPITLGPDGHWRLELGAERAKSVAAVYNYMLWDNGTSDAGVGLQVLFGVSNEVDADWQSGVFTENFSGLWGCIDDAQVYMRPVSVGDGYILYSCPILLNGVNHSLFVSLETSGGNEAYTILGVRKTADDAAKSMAARELAPKDMARLQPGDTLEPLHYFMIREGGAWRKDAFAVQSITIGENPVFYEKSLGDGHFKIMFSIVDYAGNDYLSQAGDYKVKDGKIERVEGWEVYPQPQGTIKGISLQRESGANGVHYTTILEPGLFDANWEALRLPGRASSYTIEVFTRETDVNLDDYVGERTVYLQGGFSDGRRGPSDYGRVFNYDMVFEVTGIMAAEGGAAGSIAGGTLKNHQGPPSSAQPIAGNQTAALGQTTTGSDAEVLELATRALSLLKNKDWGALGALVHPEKGLTFSPWGYVDTENCARLGAGDVKALEFYDMDRRIWGVWPSDEPMEYTIDEYYEMFIMDYDFTQAPQSAVNRIIRSEFENNLRVFGDDCVFAEFHIPGSGPEADYNWASLRLVFAPYGGELYLAGVVHDTGGS